MSGPIGLLMLSFFITSILIVPFIDFLYRIKFRRQRQETRDPMNQRTPIFDKLNTGKVGTPVGGGGLIILVVTILSLWTFGVFGIQAKIWEMVVLLFSFVSFGLLGLYDDAKKFAVDNKKKFWGLRMRHKLIIQIILALIIALIFYYKLEYDFIYVKWIGEKINLGILFIPLVMFVVLAFTNAFNITDGLDGLSPGLLVISLFAFLILSHDLLKSVSFLSFFISIWIGSVIAFLYFNVPPARIWLGDVGALSFGATLAVVGLLTGKILAVTIIGGIFVIEVGSSLLQLLSKRFFGRKLFAVAPFHLLLRYIGWEEPKVVMRLWLAGIMLAVFGLWIGLM